MSNREYLILLKFLNGENFKGFYNALDKLILESIPSFNELDICDKAYIYVAYYFYSVRSSISIKSDKVDSAEVPLTRMLDSLEKNYNKEYVNIKFHKWNAKIHYPTTLIFDETNSLLIDYLSALRSVEGIEITSQNLESLRKSIPLKLINDIEYEVRKSFSLNVEICKDIASLPSIVENILNPAIFYSIALIYKDLLDNFYSMQYLLTHYVRVSWDSLLDMTPVETAILYKNFVEDKERQNEKSKDGSSIMNSENLLDDF